MSSATGAMNFEEVRLDNCESLLESGIGFEKRLSLSKLCAF
jgi:hypothetical protein